jgi:hypothetical protein
MVDAAGGSTAPSKANLSLGLGVAAVVAMLIGMVISGDDDSNGWIWIVMAALGAGGLVTGLMDGRGKPVGRALIGVVLSALVLVLFLLYMTGILQ